MQIGQKADVQHAVGLIKHHVFHLVQHTILGFDVVQQPPGRGHQHFNAFFQFQRLGLHVHTAKNNRATQIGMDRVVFDRLRHLVGQLTRGQQHQGAHRMAGRRGRTIFVLEHALQQRQGKSCCLAGAGLGRAHHVTALQHHWNGLRLNRRHGLVTHVGHGARQRGGELQLGKGHGKGIGGQFSHQIGHS